MTLKQTKYGITENIKSLDDGIEIKSYGESGNMNIKPYITIALETGEPMKLYGGQVNIAVSATEKNYFKHKEKGILNAILSNHVLYLTKDLYDTCFIVKYQAVLMNSENYKNSPAEMISHSDTIEMDLNGTSCRVVRLIKKLI